MAQGKPGFSWQTTAGEPITVGDVMVTPLSHALIAHWPFGGLVWNRPLLIRVKLGEQETNMPITDVTRIAQLAMLGLGLVFTIIASISFVQQRRKQHE